MICSRCLRILQACSLQNKSILSQHKKISQTSSYTAIRKRYFSVSHLRLEEDKFEVFAEDIPAGENVFEDDPDTFGDLAKKHNVTVFKIPTTHLFTEAENNELNETNVTEKNAPYWFHTTCKNLARKGKLDECVQLLETQMLKEEKVKPQEYNFSVVIGALGKAGKMDKAFSLFYKLKDYGLTASLPTYTALFNSISKSRSPKALKKAENLWEEMQSKEIKLDRLAFGSALNAFGTHSSLERTMEILKASIAGGIEPDEVTFSLLLNACKSDRKSGYLHAIQCWRLMLSFRVKPSAQAIMNLLLVVKNCGLGDMEHANRVLLSKTTEEVPFNMRRFQYLKGQESHPKPVDKDNQKNFDLLLLADGTLEQIESNRSTNHSQDTIPESSVKSKRDTGNGKISSNATNLVETSTSSNLLLRDKTPNEVVGINQCHEPWQRLGLIGGYENILDMMRKHKIKGSSRIYSALAEVMPPSSEAEDAVIKFADRRKEKLDVDFFNCLMRRRFRRKEYDEGEQIMTLIEKRDVEPNYRTWCCYAISRRSFSQGKAFLELLDDKEIKPGDVILHTLVAEALRFRQNVKLKGNEDVWRPDYRYLSYLIEQLRRYGIPADENLVYILEAAAETPRNYNKWETSNQHLDFSLQRFRKVYNDWLREVPAVKTDRPQTVAN